MLKLTIAWSIQISNFYLPYLVIYSKYWDTITPNYTCPKIWKKKSILLPIDVSKTVLDEWQPV